VNIFFYTPFYPPQSQAAAVRCYWLVQALKGAGHSVDVRSSVETNDSCKLAFNPADNKQSFAKRLIYEILAGIELSMEIFASPAELFVLSSPPFITVSIAHLACRLRGKKYILDVRDIYPEVYFAQGLIKEASLLGRLVKKFTARMYAGAHGVITVTPGLVQKIQRLAHGARVELIINGYDRDLFRPSAEKYEKFTVIFHGNMGKVQNLASILKVAEKLSGHQDIEFIFIGEGPQSELLKKTRLPNVRYLGARAYTEIPALISRAHVGFSARRDDDIGSDAFPVKAFEYLGVGIPVIITPKSGSMTELAGEGVFEFSNEETDAIAALILRLKSSGYRLEGSKAFARQDISKKILNLCDLQ
jgi:glycosyltransferase involved in cell wall biosynthesis